MVQYLFVCEYLLFWVDVARFGETVIILDFCKGFIHVFMSRVVHMFILNKHPGYVTRHCSDFNRNWQPMVHLGFAAKQFGELRNAAPIPAHTHTKNNRHPVLELCKRRNIFFNGNM